MDAVDPTASLTDRLAQAERGHAATLARLQELRKQALYYGTYDAEVFDAAEQAYTQAVTHLVYVRQLARPQPDVLALVRDAVENPTYEPAPGVEQHRWEFARFLVQTGRLSDGQGAVEAVL